MDILLVELSYLIIYLNDYLLLFLLAVKLISTLKQQAFKQLSLLLRIEVVKFDIAFLVISFQPVNILILKNQEMFHIASNFLSCFNSLLCQVHNVKQIFAKHVQILLVNVIRFNSHEVKVLKSTFKIHSLYCFWLASLYFMYCHLLLVHDDYWSFFPVDYDSVIFLVFYL